jgi:basic membrane lipoprotein Med (substrate-binding protein (PBP1-ABC) superfamily)/ABC-type phosphate/phosphonate transport system substrate-binding protein
MHDLVGQTLGQYRIIEQLGKGGMATVFKAFQPSLERYVAVKVLPPYFAHEEGFSERFVREAKAIARLDHPHILPIYDYGQDHDVSYIAMKYVEAGTLKDIESAGPVSLEQALEIISQTAEALDYAHAQGVIHRDIKPANILMDHGRWVLLTDFGLAKMIEGSQQLTASGVGVGTPAYMAPEQGQGQRVDGRADIYSLGIVLYEMLTGCVPYEAETPLAVVLKHVTEPLRMPRLVNPNIPEAVELVILKALAKEPDDRYQTVGELATALRNAVEDAQLLGQTDTAWPTAPESAFAEPVVTVKAPEQPPELAPSDEITVPEVAPEAGVEAAQMPTEVVPGVTPVAQELAVEAPLPEPEPELAAVGAEAEPRPSKRRIPWWVFAVGGVLLVALIAVGVGFAFDWFGEGDYPEATAVAGQPPSKPTRPPPKEGGPPGQDRPLLVGVVNRPYLDVGSAIEILGAYLTVELEHPVEVVVIDDPTTLPGMLRDGAVDVVSLTTVEFVWLRGDENVPVKPVIFVPPIFHAELFVRDDGSVDELTDLRGRRVAVASWDNWAGILGMGAAIDEGLKIHQECEIVYVAPTFNPEANTEALRLLVDGEVDAAIVGGDSYDRAVEEIPGIEDNLDYWGESDSMVYGVIAVMPHLPEDQVWALYDALENADPEQIRAMVPFGEFFAPDEQDRELVERFAQALSAIGLEAWRLVENVPPGQEPPPPPPPPEPGAERPQPGELRVAVVPAPGWQVDGSRLLTPIVQSIFRASEDYGFELAVVENPGDANPVEVANRHIEEGFNVIVAVAWQAPEELWRLAEERPEVTFVVFGAPPRDPMPNVAMFGYRMGEMGFLAGALAGQASEKGMVGIVVGPRTNYTNQLLGGYEKGLGHSCPDCELIVRDADSFEDVDLGLGFGRELVAEGADVVFNAAGGTGSAAIRSAAEQGAWVIGVDWDEFKATFQEGRTPGADHLLGSVVVRADKYVYKALASLAEGRFEPGVHAMGIAEEGVEFIPSPGSGYPRQDELNGYLKELIVDVREGRMRP